MAGGAIRFRPDPSLSGLQQLQGSEEVCEAAREKARWPDGFRCPRCGGHGHAGNAMAWPAFALSPRQVAVIGPRSPETSSPTAGPSSEDQHSAGQPHNESERQIPRDQR